MGSGIESVKYFNCLWAMKISHIIKWFLLIIAVASFISALILIIIS